MPTERRKISLIYFVILTLLLVGLVPLVLTGWLFSDKSGRELRAAENRYQIQLVQEKARQIEMFGRRMGSVVSSLSNALQLAHDPALVSSNKMDAKLGAILRETPDLAALYVKAEKADPVVARRDSLSPDDVASIASEISDASTTGKLAIGKPRKIEAAGLSVMSFSSKVIIDGSATATIVAIASLQNISRSIVGISPTKDEDLWKAGLPIVFVVDQSGEAVFHPDRTVSASNRPMNDLKIVQEWQESGGQVQSALVPFSANYNGKTYNMIGAYSTAEIGDGYNLGVITMQDESRALASVGEMRTQAWLISMAFAVCALFVGLAGARFMTLPLLKLVNAAKRDRKSVV